MLNVRQFRYGSDNFAYLIYGEKLAMAVDGGATSAIIDFLQMKSLELMFVANTHGHSDHTSGNDQLLQITKARFLSFSELADGKEIHLTGEKIVVYRTPGHTDDSVCFHAGHFLVAGDTLFNATIGNCFTGDLQSFYRSIKRLMSLPDETVVYAGHDYVLNSLSFAQFLEPDNKNIDDFRNSYRPDHVFSTIGDEHRVNPYFRFNQESIINALKARGLLCATEWERWESLMSIE